MQALLGYNWFWLLVMGGIAVVVIVIGGGIWYELRKLRKAAENRKIKYEDDDIYDRQVR